MRNRNMFRITLFLKNTLVSFETFHSRYKRRHHFTIKAVNFIAGRKEREPPERYGTLGWAVAQGLGRG